MIGFGFDETLCLFFHRDLRGHLAMSLSVDEQDPCLWDTLGTFQSRHTYRTSSKDTKTCSPPRASSGDDLSFWYKKVINFQDLMISHL